MPVKPSQYVVSNSKPSLTLQERDFGIADTAAFRGEQYAALVQVATANMPAVALALRPGAKSCSMPLPSIAQLPVDDDPGRTYESIQWIFNGIMNLHTMATFDDGVKWLARIRATDAYSICPEREMRRRVLRSEVITTRLLHQIDPKLIPNAYGPPTVFMQEAPLPDYLFVDFMEGEVIDGENRYDPGYCEQPLRDLAALFVKLACKPFEGIGSLQAKSAEGEPAVGPLFSVWATTYPSTYPHGPFRTNAERYLTEIDHKLLLVEAGLDGTHHPVAEMLWYLEARALVEGDSEMATVGPTFLHHGDEKHDILLAKDGRLSGVIDWEMAYTAPFAEAFCGDFVVHADFWKGSNKLSSSQLVLIDEFRRLGRHDLAQAVIGGPKYHRIKYALWGLGQTLGHEDVVNVWALRSAFLGEEGAGPMPRSVAEWMDDAKRRFADHEGLQRVIAMHPVEEEMACHVQEIDSPSPQAATDEAGYVVDNEDHDKIGIVDEKIAQLDLFSSSLNDHNRSAGGVEVTARSDSDITAHMWPPETAF